MVLVGGSVAQGFLGSLNGFLDGLGIIVRNLVLVILGEFLGLVDGVLQEVLGVNGFTLLFVLFGVSFSLGLSLGDVILGHIAGVLDGDGLFLAGAFILGGDVQDAVGVNVEGDFNLRDATGSRSDTIQDEAAEGFVVGGHFALTLEDVDFNLGLVIGSGRENFGLGSRDGGVALNQLGGNATHGLNAE